MSDIKICLFNPIDVPTYPPLNLTYLSAYLKKYGKYKYEIKMVDINCSEDPIEEIISFSPHIVGMTSLSSHIVEIYNMSNEIRRLNKDILQIFGGAHATVSPEEPLRKASFDITVIGEGEVTFAELVDSYIENGKRMDKNSLSSIQGIAFKYGNDIKVNPPRPIISDIDTIPSPDRELLNNDFYNKRYFIYRGMSTNGVATIAASRGCPFNCIFCCVNFVAKSKVRFHSAKYVVGEIEELVSKYMAKWLFFTDDTFLVNKEKTMELCESIIRKGLNKKVKWEVQIRSNLVKEKDLPLLQLMKHAGCEQIDYGFESGNPRVLTLIKGKGITVEDHQRAIDITNEAGIKVMGTFILGTPTETYEEMLDTRAFVIKNYEKIHRFQVGCMIPYPGTPVYELCIEKGLISDDYYGEQKKEKDEHTEHGMRIYSDIVPAPKVIELRKELDMLALKKITFNEKLQWLIYNMFNSPQTVVVGVKWFFSRIIDGEEKNKKYEVRSHSMLIDGRIEEDSYGGQKRLQFIRNIIEKYQPKLVLDIGCGTGTGVTIPLAEHFHNIHFVGADTDVDTLNNARNHNILPNLVFIELKELEGYEKFELIIASEVIEHIAQPEQFLLFLKEKLANNGKIIITLPNGYGPFEFTALLEVLIHLSGIYKALKKFKILLANDSKESVQKVKRLNTLAITPHLQFFSYSEIVGLLKNVGLDIKQYCPRTLLCGAGFNQLLRWKRLIYWNAKIADYLPACFSSDWMFLVEKKGGMQTNNYLYRQGYYARFRRYLNEKYVEYLLRNQRE